MFGIDAWQEIYYTIKRNRLRSALTAFGVFWGIFMLVLLLGAGKGMQNGLENMFSSDLRTSMWIFTRSTSIPYKGLSPGRILEFSMEDIAAVKNSVEGVKYLSAEKPLGSFFRGDTVITYKEKAGSFSVFGVADDYFKIKVFQDYHYGRRLNHLDSKESRKVATIGTRVAAQLFPEYGDPTGEFITINGVSFKVVGVFYDAGWEGTMSERIYLPLETFQKTFGGGRKVALIAAVPKEGYSGYEVQDEIIDLLKERMRIAPEDNKAIFVANLADQVQNFNSLFGAINAFVWFVGIGTLMAGIVGISNIMIITVKERTKEIGVRKALGARPVNIVGSIVTESISITALAGYLGLVVGVGILELINYFLKKFDIDTAFFERPEVDFNMALNAIVLLVVIGAVAGIVPAIRAARVTPVEAMRAE